jgi:hypothetical protein
MDLPLGGTAFETSLDTLGSQCSIGFQPVSGFRANNRLTELATIVDPSSGGSKDNGSPS